MEDLYKDNPNSWLHRTNFSRMVYHQPDLSQVPCSVFTKSKLESSNPKPNQISNPKPVTSVPVTHDNTSKPNKTDTITSEKVNQDAISIPVTGKDASKTSQLITTSSLMANPDSSFTGRVHEASDPKTNKTARTSKHQAISDMLQKVKVTVRRRVGDPTTWSTTEARTVKSNSRPKNESRWVQKYFKRGVREVSALEKSCETR